MKHHCLFGLLAVFAMLLSACEEPDPSDDDSSNEPDNPLSDDDDSVDPCAGSSAGAVMLSESQLSLDWWQGEKPPSRQVQLSVEVPQCAHLVAQVSADWLSASLSENSLQVTLNAGQVVSGRHSAAVVLWDSDTDAIAAELAVDLASLVRPALEASRNVLVVGVDGLDGEELRDISVPVMERLMLRGFWSYAASTQVTGASSSGPGWTSIQSGVETSKHGVTHNGGYDGRNTDYPSFLYRAKTELGLATAASIQWGDIWDILEEDAADATGSGTMDEVSETMNGLLRSGLYQVHFVHLDDVDGAGHSNGYLATEEGYSDAVQEVDGMIGEMIDAILERPDIENEHWLLLVTSDHGGNAAGSHGAMSSDYQTIPLIIAGPGLGATQLDPGEGTHMDIHPTVVDFLGLDPAGYGLDGISWWEREWERECDDGLDDDGDGLIDCDDPDCDIDAACMECPVSDLGDATGSHVVDPVPFNEHALTGTCGGSGAESSYSWTAPASGRYSFDTVGAHQDTVLYALAGACDGEELACSDDIPGLGGGRSGFSLDVVVGDVLVIVVDSHSSSVGPSVLSVHPYVSGCPTVDLGPGTGTWSGSFSSFDQAHQEACPPAVGNLQFTWTAPADGTYTYSTAGSDFDTVIYLLDECGGAELGCNDDSGGLQSELSFAALAGEEFIVGLGGFDTSEGDYVITIE